MEIKTFEPADHQIAIQKLRIIRQQELAAELVRSGRDGLARQARAKLLSMLSELDIMQATHSTSSHRRRRQAAD